MYPITRSQAAKYDFNKSINEIEWLVNLLKIKTSDDDGLTPIANKFRKMFSYTDSEEELADEDKDQHVGEAFNMLLFH